MTPPQVQQDVASWGVVNEVPPKSFDHHKSRVPFATATTASTPHANGYNTMNNSDGNSMSRASASSGDGRDLSREHTFISIGGDSDSDTTARLLPGDDDAHRCRPFLSSSTEKGGGDYQINPRVISDAILGLSDGLTVPFALSAGLSSFGNSRVVVLGSLAELVAGAISMGLGGYVGAKSEAETYRTLECQTSDLVHSNPGKAYMLLHSTLSPYSIPEHQINGISQSLHSSPDNLLQQFLMTFHHKETPPDVNQAWVSAVTLAVGYFIGGFIPLVPYFLFDQVGPALAWSAAVMAVTLFVFGYVKTCIVRGWTRREDVLAGLSGALQMVVVGGIAAGAAVALVNYINRFNDGNG